MNSLKDQAAKADALTQQVKESLTEDFGARIAMVSLFLRNVGIAGRYRAEIFGNEEADAKVCGSYISVSTSAADTLTKQMEATLGYFKVYVRTDEEKQYHAARHERLTEKVNGLAQIMKDVMTIAETDQIPEKFGVVAEAVDTKKLFTENNLKIAESLAKAFDRMAKLEDTGNALFDTTKDVSERVEGLEDSLRLAGEIKGFAFNMKLIDAQLKGVLTPVLLPA